MIFADVSLGGIQKIPFTSSYLPAKRGFHPFWAFIELLIPISAACAERDRSTLASVSILVKVLVGMVLVALLVRWKVTPEKWEEVPVDHIQVLGLARDGGRPVEVTTAGQDGGRMPETRP